MSGRRNIGDSYACGLLDKALFTRYVSVMTSAIQTAPKVWTEDEIQALPDDGYKREIVHGEVIMGPKNNFEHDGLVGRLFLAKGNFNNAHKLGAILGSNLGCWMKNRNCRAPDISFIARERLRKFGFKFSTQKFFPESPDLTIEVVSLSNTRAEIESRLKDFFASGAKLVWIIHPDEQFVEISHSPTDRTLVGAGGQLDGEQLLPGFLYSIDDLFAPEEWSDCSIVTVLRVILSKRSSDLTRSPT